MLVCLRAGIRLHDKKREIMTGTGRKREGNQKEKRKKKKKILKGNKE